MATQTLIEIQNSPTINTVVWGPYALMWRVIGTVGSWTVDCTAWTLANGGGSKQVCGNVAAFQHDWTNGATINSFNQNNVVGVTATSSAAITAGHTVGGQGRWQTSGSPGSLVITTTYDNSFGIVNPFVRRSGVWQAYVNNSGGARRTGAWAGGPRGRVRRSGAWNGLITALPLSLVTRLQMTPQKLLHSGLVGEFLDGARQVWIQGDEQSIAQVMKLA